MIFVSLLKDILQTDGHKENGPEEDLVRKDYFSHLRPAKGASTSVLAIWLA